MIAYLALGAAVAAALAAVALKAAVPAAVHALAPVLVAALWAYALWLGRRAIARRYHRHGRPGLTHHRRPPLAGRALHAAARLRTLRLTTTRTA